VTVFGLLNQPPQPLLMGVVNAASLQPGPVAPGSLISIFGHNLAQDIVAASAGGVNVFVNGIPAPLQFVSSGQINAQVPFETAPGSAVAELRLASMPPAAIPFAVASVAPGIFASGPNQAGVRNADGTSNSPDNPAAPGSQITVYLTGQGAVVPPVPTGAPAPLQPISRPAYPVTATVGGVQAAVVLAGLCANSVGTLEVQLRLPMIDSGSYPLLISIDGVTSNARQVSISGN